MPKDEVDVNSEENIQNLMKWLTEEQLPRYPIRLDLIITLAKTAGKKGSWYSITTAVENLIKEKEAEFMIFGDGSGAWGIQKKEKFPSLP